MFFLSSKTNLISSSELIIADAMLIILYILIASYSMMKDFMLWEVLILFVSLTLWSLCKDFTSWIHSCSDNLDKSDWKYIWKFYRQLKKLSKLISDIYCPTLLFYAITILFYYSSNVNILFVENNNARRMFVVLYMTTEFVTLWKFGELSASVTGSLKRIASKKSMKFRLPKRKMLFLVHELDSSHRISIKIGNAFSLTFGTLGKVGGFILPQMEQNLSVN